MQSSPQDTASAKELRDSFKKIAGEDMEIDAYELQDILNAAFLKGRQIYLVLHQLLNEIMRLRLPLSGNW